MQTLLHLLILIGMATLFSNCKTDEKNDPKPGINQPEDRSTVVYLVRHAEKANAPINDPDLSLAGQERAEALQAYFKDIPVEGLFTSPYKRTRQTLEPLAQAKNLTIQEYSTQNFESLPDTIAARFTGKTVIIAGHTNTVLETIEAFNVPRPVTEIAETKYDYLFKLTLHPGKDPEVEVLRYGL